MEGLGLDIASATTAYRGAAVMQKVSTAVLDRSLDTMDQQGAQIVNLISSAPGPTVHDVNPAVGGHIDVAV